MRKRYYVGVDVGATFTKMALVDETGRIVSRTKNASKNFTDKIVFAKSLRKGIRDLLHGCGLSFRHIGAVGIGLPGPIDAPHGTIINLTNIRGWSHFPLVRFLKKFIPVPVFIENDANCMALAESRVGAARGARYAVCLTLGTGVGAGLILDRRVYRGFYYFGGEAGHVPLSLDGPRCVCGGRGCLEKYVGNRSIARRARTIFKRGVSLEELSDLAAKGDPRAKKIWREVGGYLGLALAGLMNVFNPQVIVIGGGVAAAGPVLFEAIKRTIERHAMKMLKPKVNVRPAQLGNEAGMLGAALLAKENSEEK